MPSPAERANPLLGRYLTGAEWLGRHGARPVMVVSRREAAGVPPEFPRGDLVVVPDPDRIEDILFGLARSGFRLGDFESVQSLRESTVVNASVLGAIRGVHAEPGLDAAVALRDKHVQKAAIRAAGIRTADSRVVERFELLRADPPEFPFVVKPIAGSGTKATFAVRSQPELDQAAKAVGEVGDVGPWLVEEFIEGVELHVDGIVRDRKLHFCAVSRYLQNVIEIKDGGVVGSVALTAPEEAALCARVRDLAARALTALGLREGVFHLEVFDRGTELVFGECAGRIGGGMIKDCVQRAYGVDLLEEWARSVLGLLPNPVPAPAAEVFGWIHLQAPAGRVLSAPSAADLEAEPGCVLAEVGLKEGTDAPDPAAASSVKAGRLMVAGADSAGVAERVLELADRFRRGVLVEDGGPRP
ncbi:MAG TPA: ATP-grasp domain-containing protein [Actinospica sp.]|nr:ATP-grasp domain-containing protein [Actinospica sp.]